ncbi:MAG: UvrB/UvrC motif-containing protein [Christensenellales bacterium]|jgi:protein arginine kinase activator
MMLCDRCSKNPAVIHLTRITQSGRSELHLCMQCATGVAKMTQQKAQAKYAIDQTLARACEQDGVNLKCPGCGFTVSDIRKTGTMGCSLCYETFADLIEPVISALRRTSNALPGAKKQAAPLPTKPNPNEAMIRDLRERMKQAVSREEYETAALLRDQIKALEAR